MGPGWAGARLRGFGARVSWRPARADPGPAWAGARLAQVRAGVGWRLLRRLVAGVGWRPGYLDAAVSATTLAGCGRGRDGRGCEGWRKGRGRVAGP
jgi:hypothetical protein